MSHSGLQRDILSFYKMVLRKAQQQPPEMRKCIEDYARSEFRKNAYSVKKSDFYKIDYLCHQGMKMYKQLDSPGFAGFSFMKGSKR
ncbi:hypothetical protein BLSTO_02911 [Blastocystis sp. subtype 1]